MKGTRIFGVALALTAPIAQSDEPASPEPARLREIAVSATRVEQATDEIPATTTVIDAQDMTRTLTNSIRDLLRYEPNVSVTNDPNRFGADGFNIRGLAGNRVLMLVDGIRVPDRFSFGSFSLSGRNVVDLDSLKRVEIVRGPASSLYGSDALGGVVSFVTKDPNDYLAATTRPWYASIKSGWAEADESWHNTLTLAGGGNALSGMLLYTHRNGHEVGTQGTDGSVGPTRTVANPSDTQTDNLFAKLVAMPDASNVLRLALERYNAAVQTNILSLNPQTPQTSALAGDDETQRSRVSLEHEYRRPTPGWLARTKAIVYYQVNETHDHTDETRTNTNLACGGSNAAVGNNTCAISRDFTFEQEVVGATAQIESLIDTGNAAHRAVYGFDYSFTRTAALRDGTVFNVTAGTVTKRLSPDTFPVRDFPASDTHQLGVFAQDEIALIDARLLVTPALRYDYYALEVKPDDIYLANAPPEARASDFSDSALSPKIGVLYRLTPATSVYGQYAHGFRAPPFDDLNAAFRNPGQYVVIPNPNLRSETSQGVEVGVRGDYGRARFSVAAFFNRYRDFIDAAAQLVCPGDPSCVDDLITFQSINRAKVRIWGVEATGEYRFAREWSVVATVGYARGDDLTTDQPLNTIDPPKGVIALNYAGASRDYGGTLAVTAVAEQRRVDETAGPRFKTPGYAVCDLTAFWNVTRRLSINAGVFNLFDHKYWLWSTVANARGVTLGPNAPALDRYTEPGRNIAATVSYVF